MEKLVGKLAAGNLLLLRSNGHSGGKPRCAIADLRRVWWVVVPKVGLLRTGSYLLEGS